MFFYYTVLLLSAKQILGGSIPTLFNNRIVGGSDTTIENFPYQISLRKSGIHSCGGSVLSSNIIITAAHCVDGYFPSVISIVAGTSFRNRGGISIQAEEIIIHPDFTKRSSYDHDIALIKLKESFVFQSTIQPIQLPSEGIELDPGSAVIISGWGTLETGGQAPEKLHFVEIEIISNYVCKKAYGNILTDTMLCAGSLEGGKDSCQGDSGGPLVYQNWYTGTLRTGTLYGIISFGDDCAKPGYPGVYTKISSLRNWIDSTVAQFNTTLINKINKNQL